MSDSRSSASTGAGWLLRLLVSPVHWCALVLAALVLGLKIAGLLGAAGWWLAVLGYAVGLGIGVLWFGLPPRDEATDWQALQFSDEGDAREAMERALSGVREAVERNPGNRIPSDLRQRVLALCSAMDELMREWENSKGELPLQDSFDARHIAIRHLPEMLNAYLSIPARFATTQVIDRGRTAAQILRDTLAELEAKVRQLADDLAAQDAQAFVVHSRFLSQKFATANPLAPVLDLSKDESRS